jgi:nucleoside 2-deoxyribosyltransferase
MSCSFAGPRVYLAGPEVFLPEAQAVGARKVAMCAEHGLIGLYPADQALDLTGLTAQGRAQAIARANEGLMHEADALIANLTPFRGPSMDCGTAYEVGFMRALGRPVYGYTSEPDDYYDRASAFRYDSPRWRDGDRPGTLIENFGLAENLMIDRALCASGHPPVRAPIEGVADITDLVPFEVCLAAVAPLILSRWSESRT